MRVEVGLIIEYDAKSYRERDTVYAQIRSAFEKIEPFVEKQYGVRMAVDVQDLKVIGKLP